VLTHGEEFEETVLGQLPQTWRLMTLGAVVQEAAGVIQTGPFGSQLHARDYVTLGVPVVMPQDIAGHRIDTSGIARIVDTKARELARHRLRLNDVVVARRGDLTRAVAISDREVEWLCGTGCLLIRLPYRVSRASWLTALYQHEVVQAQVRALAVGSTMPNLSGQILARLLLPLPPIAEQDRIAHVLSSHDERLDAEVAQVRKLWLLKQGLMADLLTGRVRVSDGTTREPRS
jgi:type I restriction enzyme S subunit